MTAAKMNSSSNVIMSANEQIKFGNFDSEKEMEL